MKFSVNGQEREVAAPDDMPLLWVLRDLLGLTGTKYGCGIGQCGACTVHVDGEPRRSCVTTAGVGGRQVGHHHRGPRRRTRATPVQRAWAELDVVQCGYCQSGPDHGGRGADRRQPATRPTPTSTPRSAGNLCRCGTYQRVRAAVHRARRAAPGGTAT